MNSLSSTLNHTMAVATQNPHLPAAPLSMEEEDALIHSRIVNDEKPLRRLTKKFHAYSSLVFPSAIEIFPSNTSVDDAREAFLIELAGFQLQLRKAQMVCEVEYRQGELYRKESRRIAEERTHLRMEIDDLKTSLEQAQLERRRKIEYDQIAEKINHLPSREELELAITALDGDIQVIKDEHETQDRNILLRKSALDAVIIDLDKVLQRGVLKRDEESAEPFTTHPPAMEVDETEGEQDPRKGDERAESPLDPPARPFTPSSSLLQAATQQLRAQSSSSVSKLLMTPSMSRENTPAFAPIGGLDSRPESPAIGTPVRQEEEDGQAEEGEEVEDVEMGEVSEKKNEAGKDDREEGEASDGSSVLSDPPEE